MSGDEVAGQLNQQSAFANTLRIAMSGYGQESQTPKKSPFHYHLVKPIQFDTLIKLIGQHRHQAI